MTPSQEKEFVAGFTGQGDVDTDSTSHIPASGKGTGETDTSFDDPPQSGYHGEKAPQGQEPPAPPREGDTSDGASAVFHDAEAEDKRGYSGGEYTANSPTEYPNVSYPGDDPHTPPGKGWEWRGPADKGSYYNPKTGESMRPDLDHGQPIGPHWDYKAPDGKWYRLYPDGSIVPKK